MNSDRKISEFDVRFTLMTIIETSEVEKHFLFIKAQIKYSIYEVETHIWTWQL